MNFRIWFKQWIRSIHRLLLVNRPIKLNERQKERYRRNRLKAMCHPRKRYQIKRRKRRSSHQVHNIRIAHAALGFCATSLGVLLLPLGLLQWGYKSGKQRKKEKSPSHTQMAQQADDKKKTKESGVSPPKPASPQPKRSFQNDVSESEHKSRAFPSEEPSHFAEAHDENTPKSKPRNSADQYVRKRMIVAGSYYCEAEILKTLTIGSYLSLVPEPSNPHDKNAILLLFEEKKIGYVAKKDQPPFVACFSLHRKPYGVITDILQDGKQTKYEYEVWFER